MGLKSRRSRNASLIVLLCGVALSTWTHLSGTQTDAGTPSVSAPQNKVLGKASSPAAQSRIERVTLGSLPAEEQSSVRATLRHIDAGTSPNGALAKQWGSHFKNWSGDLPGARGNASPYREFRVEPAPGTTGAGTRRIVQNAELNEVFYTWTHYGDTGKPAFVQIR